MIFYEQNNKKKVVEYLVAIHCLGQMLEGINTLKFQINLMKAKCENMNLWTETNCWNARRGLSVSVSGCRCPLTIFWNGPSANDIMERLQLQVSKVSNVLFEFNADFASCFELGHFAHFAFSFRFICKLLWS